MTLQEALDGIKAAKDREEAARIRSTFYWKSLNSGGPASERSQVGDALIAQWGQGVIGGPWPTGKAHTGD